MTINLYIRLQHCNERSHVTFPSHIYPFNVPNRPTFYTNTMRNVLNIWAIYTKHVTRSEARGPWLLYVMVGWGLRSTLTLQISNLPSALRRSHRNSLDPQTPLALALPAPRLRLSPTARWSPSAPMSLRNCASCSNAPRTPTSTPFGASFARYPSVLLDHPRFLPALRPLPFDSSLPSLDPRVPVRSRQCCVACLLVSAINSTLGYAMVAFNGKIVDSEFRLG